ncbi:hypothetical protein [Kineococcus glutinatus]|uniref:Prenyltransferase/squalene oxidase-like repeat protein n=1 Tax=Kineococcus glutinatus TaxID=1070872 RepID=A0ABP9HTM9_9ACTN
MDATRDVDVPAAVAFLATHGRVLDRRRLALLLGHAGPQEVLAALDAHRNPDGGYGWGLEPDLRDAGSQPVAAMHALEVLVEAADPTEPRAPALLDWLHRHSLPGGGLPMALPLADPAGSAPHWAGADPQVPSLQMTAQLAALAHRLVRVRTDLAGHPWLAAATAWCLDAIGRLDGRPPAHEVLFALHLLDAVAGSEPRAPALLQRLAAHVPASGLLPVEGGAPGEALRALDLSPDPHGASRALLDEAAVRADLERLAASQQPDGGWVVGFPPCSPAAALEWRGYETVRVLRLLLPR